MEQNFFQYKKLNRKKLLDYGFQENKNAFKISREIFNGDFRLTIQIKQPNIVETTLLELATDETYTLHLTTAQGSFVGQIREEYNKILEDIAEKCFEKDVFKSKYTFKVIEYIKDKYSDEVEYLWEKFPDNAIARRQDNKKWYLAILTIRKNKLGFKSEEKIEVIDLRANPDELPKLIKRENIYAGYHMNKKHWITIILDGSVELEEIFQRIDESYLLAKK